MLVELIEAPGGPAWRALGYPDGPTAKHREHALNDFMITTTPSVEGRAIQQYLGIVTGEAILGANIFKDLFAGIRDIVGGRSGAYEEELRKAREIAMSELAAVARQLGADAVVGVDLDYETVGQGGSMLMVTASGTAVRLRLGATLSEGPGEEDFLRGGGVAGEAHDVRSELADPGLLLARQFPELLTRAGRSSARRRGRRRRPETSATASIQRRSTRSTVRSPTSAGPSSSERASMKSSGCSAPVTCRTASLNRSSQVGSRPPPSGRWAWKRDRSSSPAQSSTPIASRISRLSPATRSMSWLIADPARSAQPR